MTERRRDPGGSISGRVAALLSSLAAALTTVLLVLAALTASQRSALAAASYRAAAEPGTVRLAPTSTRIGPGETVDVIVWLEAVEDYYGVDIRIAFDPTVVEVPDERVWPLWDLFDTGSHWIIRNHVNNEEGEVWYAVTNHSPAEPFAGTGRICRITFRAVITGSTTLDVPYARGSTHLGQTLEPERVGAEIAVGAPQPGPYLARLSPSSTLAGTSGLTLTAEGAGFVEGAVLKWRAAEKPAVVVSSTLLTVDLTAHDLAEAAVVSVTVVNPLPDQGTSNPLTFTVNNPAPALIALDPPSATVGTPGLTLCVTGGGFVHDSTILWNGEPRGTTRMSSTLLYAAIPAGDLAAARATAVTVANPPPGGGTSDELYFEVREPQSTPWISTVYLPLVAIERR